MVASLQQLNPNTSQVFRVDAIAGRPRGVRAAGEAAVSGSTCLTVCKCKQALHGPLCTCMYIGLYIG